MKNSVRFVYKKIKTILTIKRVKILYKLRAIRNNIFTLSLIRIESKKNVKCTLNGIIIILRPVYRDWNLIPDILLICVLKFKTSNIYYTLSVD